jgi:hypothetical protein
MITTGRGTSDRRGPVRCGDEQSTAPCHASTGSRGRRPDRRWRAATRGRGWRGRRVGDRRWELISLGSPFAGRRVARCGRSGLPGGEQPMRIGLLTDCRGLFKGYGGPDARRRRAAAARRGARLTNGKPSGDVSEARAPAETSSCQGCTETEFTVLVEEARRLVEVENVDAVVGPIGDADQLVIRELARKHPEVIFIQVWGGPQDLTLRHPAANVYRFDTDTSRWRGRERGYRELGWRRAAVVFDVSPARGRRKQPRREFCARRAGDGALHGADRPRRPEGRPRSPRRRRRRAYVWGPSASRVSARARPRARLRPGSSADTCSRTQHARAHRGPTRRGRRRASIRRQTQHPMRRHRTAFSKAFPAAALGRGNIGCWPSTTPWRARCAGSRSRRRPLGWSLTAARGAHASETDLPSAPAPRPEPPAVRQHLPEASRSRGRPAGSSSSGSCRRSSRHSGSLSDAPGPGSQPCRKATRLLAR